MEIKLYSPSAREYEHESPNVTKAEDSDDSKDSENIIAIKRSDGSANDAMSDDSYHVLFVYTSDDHDNNAPSYFHFAQPVPYNDTGYDADTDICIKT